MELKRSIRYFLTILFALLVSEMVITSALYTTKSSKIEFPFRHVRDTLEVKIVSANKINFIRFYGLPGNEGKFVKIVADGEVVDSVYFRKGWFERWSYFDIENPPDSFSVVASVNSIPGERRRIAWTMMAVEARTEDGRFRVFNLLLPNPWIGLKGMYPMEFSRGNDKEINWFVWDGAWYRRIATGGYTFDGDYTRQQTPQFPPLYPLLSRLVANIIEAASIERVMQWLSRLMGLMALLCCFLFLCRIYDSESAMWTTLLLIFYPGFLYLHFPYSESLALLLGILSFYLFFRKKYVLAFTIIGLSTAARIQMVFLSIAFLLVYFMRHRHSRERLLKLLYLAPISLNGIIAYSLYLMLKFGDPFIWYKLNRYAWGSAERMSMFHILKVNLINLKYVNFHLLLLPRYDYLLVISIILLILAFYALRFGLLDELLILSAVPFLLLVFSLFTQRVPPYESLTRHIYTIFPLFVLMPRALNRNFLSILLPLFLVMLYLHALLMDPGYGIHPGYILRLFPYYIP